MSKLAWIAAAVLALPASAMAQDRTPRLIHPAEFGTVHEVEGDKLPVATARTGCPVSAQPAGGGPCFDKLIPKLTTTPQRVLGLYAPARAGDRVTGRYGGDFALFDVRMDGKTLVAQRHDLQTSNVMVPRDCFALNGEGVGYVIENEAGADVAYESQLVICGGGPERPNGPYTPEGAAIHGGPDAWHRTEMKQLWGQRRYLATTGGTCDSQYSLRTTWCAQPAITYLQAHPEVKELDLIAARQPVRDGDRLSKSQIDQWVLKRKGESKFKADGRWVDKSFLDGEGGCTAVEAIGWQVSQESDGLYVTETALHGCGAPPAPVPTAVYEAYGDDFFIVDCADHGWRNKDYKGNCFDQARDYLRHDNRKSATVVVLNERGRVDDHLYPGGYVSYDVANVRLNDDGSVTADKTDYYSDNVYLSNCSEVGDGPAERRGFVLVRSMGITWARAYKWMNCPVY